MARIQAPVTPQQIIQHLWAARAAQALIAGVELDVFSLIAEGERYERSLRMAQALLNYVAAIDAAAADLEKAVQ